MICYQYNKFNVYMEGSQSSTYLLEWLNLERSNAGRHRFLSSYLQVLQEGFLEDILTSIDEDSFQSFGHVQSSKKLDILDRYLQKEFGKRIKWTFKQSFGTFTEEDHIREFVKLVLFFSIHSKNKNDYVGRILTLSEESQRYLMEQMQKMDDKIENITEIKEIIEQIEYLECENEDLKTKLAEMARVNSQMLELLKQNQQQTKTLKTEINAYRKEKSQLFQTLEIYSISEYLEIYKQLKRESQKYLDCLREASQKLDQSQDSIKSLTDRIKSDAIVISNLSDEISRLKELNYENQRELSWLWPHSNSKLNLLKSATSNKQNISKCSTTLGKESLEVPTEWASFTETEEQNNQKSLIRLHNGELAAKLQGMYGKYNSLNNQSAGLREQNKKIAKRHAKLRQVLKQVESTYKEFQFKYKAAVAEDRQLFKKIAPKIA